MNGGVILSTTARARRDPRWPESWKKDWDRYEATASDMLKAQSLQVKFQNSKILEGVMSGEYDKETNDSMKLSMNIEIERSQETGSCLACGNCLAGCPYNAKNSTDKTYLVSAVKVCLSLSIFCLKILVKRNVSSA